MENKIYFTKVNYTQFFISIFVLQLFTIFYHYLYTIYNNYTT